MRAHDAGDTGRSQRAIRTIRSAASFGVERFSLPLALSSGRIIFRCSFVCPAPISAIVRETRSMPSRSMSTLVALLSDSTIIATARSCRDSSDPPSEKY